jgi:hypothetical protein
MNNRDDFSEKVRRAVAARAGWHCSFAGCGKLTVGPSDESPYKSTNIGKAAHICAAPPGGRRYNVAMTPEGRSDIGNAMWLCADHADLIDRDEVTYTTEGLLAMKRGHEVSCAQAVRTGSSASLMTGLIAIGPNIVCTAELSQIEVATWTLRLGHFLIGDIHGIAAFIDGFSRQATEDKYVLSNELGDGRVLVAAPALTKLGEGYSLRCPVAPGASRIEAQNIGTGFALDTEAHDLTLNKKGSFAVVSGVDYLPQRIREVLSVQRGESPFWPTFGMRFFEYFEAYRGSPWLDLLFKLDVVRQAAIPYRDNTTTPPRTPLQCVTRVRNLEILAHTPEKSRLPIRLDLDVQGLGTWSREISVYVPSADQMALIAKRRADIGGLTEVVKET